MFYLTNIILLHALILTLTVPLNMGVFLRLGRSLKLNLTDIVIICYSGN